MAETIGNRGQLLKLLIRKGATFGPYPLEFTDPDGLPINLAGATLRGKMRKSYAAQTSYDFVFTITDAVGGKAELSMAAEITATIPCGESPLEKASRYVWDCEIQWSDGTVFPLFRGPVSVAAEATR